MDSKQARAAVRLLNRAMAEQGMRPGVPDGLDPVAEGIDRDIMREARCGGCNRKSLAFHPFTDGMLCRVAGLCSICGEVEEF